MKTELNKKRLFRAIALFVFLALLVLAANHEVASQFEREAVSINLAGRQRMLSQRITKTLLQIRMETSIEARRALENEFRASVLLFDQTLAAFENGGMVTGGDGRPVKLSRADAEPAALLVNQAVQLWKPMREDIMPRIAGEGDIPAVVFDSAYTRMQQTNLQLLDLMNRLTYALEKTRSDVFQWFQVVVMIIALGVFALIVRGLYLLTNSAVEEGLQFENLAMRDALTGLLNRREFEIALEREFASARRRKVGMALFMIDLDGFKAINDHHGHAAGDKLLRAVASRLSEYARTNDTVARLGGDEFVLICPDMNDRNYAAALSVRLIDAINQPVVFENQKIHTGASIGIAFSDDCIGGSDDFIRLADAAMYAAKESGRNRYEFSSDAAGKASGI